MPSSTKLLRAAPQRRFEDYTLHRIVSPEVGLYPISTPTMTRVPSSTGGAGFGGCDDGMSETMSIGFDFSFEGISYKQIVVCANGFAILVDPSVGDGGLSPPVTVITDCLNTLYDNNDIKSSFTRGASPVNTVLLCPWFDDLRNVYDSLQALFAEFSTPDASTRLRINYGLDTPSPAHRYNPSTAGVRYARLTDKSGVRALVVRWNSLSNYNSPSSLLRFDLVLYENGTIEFRYDTNDGIGTSVSTYENATIGIFLNNTPSTGWRFRDFSHGLGYDDFKRPSYSLGGATYLSTYTDGASSKPYTVSLQPDKHWPGLRSSGCIMRFSPPVNRRKILPRPELREKDSTISFPLKARTGDRDRTGTRLSAFDDRKTLNFLTGVVVDYPTTIQRKYADSEPGAPNRLNLFSNMSVTSSIIKGNADNFIGNESQKYIEPFSEHNRPELDQFSLYFATGSSLEQFGDGLQTSLRSKTQIKIELPIELPTQMFDVTSSLYYYNKRFRAWYVPRNGSVLDLANPLAHLDVSRLTLPEDARQFDALGNSVSSGSNPGTLGLYEQSDPSLNTSYYNANLSELLLHNYPKSVQNNSEYKATDDEQFSLAINQPFLIEKVVFEIPLTMGSGWFNDRTTSSVPVGYPDGSIAAIDAAGPCITVALFNQQSAGPNTFRDLITSGTIIPVGDNHSHVKVNNTTLGGDTYCIFSPQGFLSFNVSPAAVVSPNRGTTAFTGSVVVNTIPGISNGVTITALGAAYQESQINNEKALINWLTNTTIDVNSNTGLGINAIYTNVKNVDVFGRSFKGFDPSGRSIFGKEFVTTQNSITKTGQYKNPFYVSSSKADLPANMKAVIANSSLKSIIAGTINLGSNFQSPYLVLPGDKLTLSISKMRPVIYSYNGTNPFGGAPMDYFTGSLRHDVTLATGSIKVTLYGSLLNQLREYHDPMNSPTSTNAVHEVLGAEPVLDQYDIEYRGAFWGTSTDDYITGSLLKIDSDGGKQFFVPASRGRVFSKLDARSQPPPEYVPNDSYEVIQNYSKAFRLQPWYEKTSRSSRVTQLISESERFYDSMVPNLNDCFKLNGSGIWFEDPNDAQTHDLARFNIGPNVGYMFFNAQIATYGSLGILDFADGIWTWAYPFEPRYSTVGRDAAFQRGIVSSRMFSYGALSMSDQDSRYITEFIPTFLGHYDGIGTIPSVAHAYTMNCSADVDLRTGTMNNPYITGSMSRTDMIKVMYGFGDVNTITPQLILGDPEGTPDYVSGTFGYGHEPDYRNYHYDGTYHWRYGPIIRGWKYGIYNAIPTNSSMIFRRDKFGQCRDMLEQRLYTKYYQATDSSISKIGPLQGPVSVKFVDSLGNNSNPINTWSSNQSYEATSSLPYFDDVGRNRPPIDVSLLNQTIFSI